MMVTKMLADARNKNNSNVSSSSFSISSLYFKRITDGNTNIYKCFSNKFVRFIHGFFLLFYYIHFGTSSFIISKSSSFTKFKNKNLSKDNPLHTPSRLPTLEGVSGVYPSSQWTGVERSFVTGS